MADPPRRGGVYAALAARLYARVRSPRRRFGTGAQLPTELFILTAEAVAEALVNAHLADDPGQVRFVEPIVRDDMGWRATVALPRPWSGWDNPLGYFLRRWLIADSLDIATARVVPVVGPPGTNTWVIRVLDAPPLDLLRRADQDHPTD